MSNLVLTRRSGQCVRLETSPGQFMNVRVAYVGADQVKFELTDPSGRSYVKRGNIAEELILCEDATLTVDSIQFRNVKLRFNAPSSIKIVRTELLDRIPGKEYAK